MPTYHVEIARVVAGADTRWVDNLLSRFPVEGVERTTHGVARRISTTALRQIALTRRLVTAFGLQMSKANDLADRLLTSSGGRVTLEGGLEIRLDLAAFDEEMRAALAEAVERVIPARRGRPPRRAGRP